jgi:ATP-dependent Clp protease ATP-binding subunit ClpA
MKQNAKLIFSYLRSHIIGQDYPLKQISNGIARGESGLSMPGRPKATFLLLGPTGVGKTESAKQSAIYLYGSLEEGYEVVDMAEYQGAEAVEDWKKLVTEKVSKRPQGGILLFDEIEKAYRDILLNFLQILDEGRLSYSGVPYDFSNWYLFFTSNLGCAEMINMKHSAYATIARTAKSAAENHLRPEVVARFSEVCVFQLLPFVHQQQICSAMMDVYLRFVHERAGLEILYEGGVVQYLLRKGFNRRLGARPLRNTIETEISLAVNNYHSEYEALAAGERVTIRVADDSKSLYLKPPEGNSHDRVDRSYAVEA